MKRRASDSEMATIYRQTGTLGRMADEGKRDPRWVSDVLQNAIEHREDGTFDVSCEVIELGEFEVNYDLSVTQMTEGAEGTFLYADRYESCIWAADNGTSKVKLGLVGFSFKGSWTMFNGHQLRAEIRRNGFYDTQLPELMAVVTVMPKQLADLGFSHDIYAMGPGVMVRGGTSNLPKLGLVDELVPKASIWGQSKEVHLTSDIVRTLDDRHHWYLVRFGIENHPGVEVSGY
jgi:hypothetical protein